MKVEDNAKISKTYSGSVVEQIDYPFPSIHKKDIGDLINQLNSEGIEINLNDSEKELRYFVQGQPKKSIIPFHVDNDNEDNVERYVLRGDGLEIELMDYQSSVPEDLMDGGSYALTAGVARKITLENEDDCLDKFFLIRKIITEFYS